MNADVWKKRETLQNARQKGWRQRGRRPRKREKKPRQKKLKDAKDKGAKAFQAGDWEQALLRYSECIELEPVDHIHWSNRSAVHKQMAKFEESLADATKCTELCPTFAKGWARAGQANVGLHLLDVAEEAFQKGLELEPENAACLDGIREIEKAREGPTEEPEEEEDEFDALLKELHGLEPAELRTRALEGGLQEEKVDDAEGSTDPKEAMINLITAHKYLVDLINEEVQGLPLFELRTRALEEGLAEDKVAAAADQDDPTSALTALILQHLSNDLVEAATDLQMEAAEEEYEDESDDNDEGDDIDFEIVTMDEADLQLGVGDVFLAGAYVDDKYGELILPNGSRLGNRSLKHFYKQRVRPTNDRALAIRSQTLQERMKAMGRLQTKIAMREERKVHAGMLVKASLNKEQGWKQKEADNKATRAIVHHWGAGGGGSHYHMCGGKQFQKGNKVKGVVLRHSRQGAKMQAARVQNKANRGNASVAVLQ